MKKFWILVIGIILIFWMTGCSLEIPLEERLEIKKNCEEAGGVYKEGRNSWDNTISHADCELEKESQD